MTEAYEALTRRAAARWDQLHARPWVRVGTGLMGEAVGALEVLSAVREAVERAGVEATVSEVGTTGLCYAEPIVDVHVPDGPRVRYGNVRPEQVETIVQRHVIGGEPVTEFALASVDSNVPGVPRFEQLPMMQGQVRVALRNAGEIDPLDVDQYVARGGFSGLDKALSSLTPQETLDEVKNSGLRGRGGAAFPTGVKWGFLAGNPAPQKYILCNCEEGDPGAFNDKTILESDPFTLVEGCIIAGYATGASNGIVFIRHGHDSPIDRTRAAIRACYDNGVLGTSVLGTDFAFDMEVSLVGESYVAGEETALMEAIEGKRSMPRFRPPFPAAYGVWGRPSNINNIKTLSYAPEIVRRGAGWFSDIGTEKSTGTAIACLSGDIRYPGLVEVPFGLTVRDVIEGMGGGEPSGKALKFLQTGGPLGGVLPAEQFDMVLDFDEMVAAGAMFGSGGLIVCNEERSVVDLTRTLVAFDQMESCGKCFPCRLGMSHILEILERIADGKGRSGDMDLMERVGVNMRGGSLCGHGQLGYNPVSSAVRFFGGEFEAQFEDGAPSLGTFVGPKSTRRGAQMSGDTPTASVKPDFVMHIESVVPAAAGTTE
ncbi:MAG: SLBB domain-containing protein [Chloroflexota bacterium]|nr:SLBB domain-containing protein [Chloroflexota bacterium]MDE2884130.1 SLBB domain-containing protein [Chloroflexota bacterium]